MIYILDHLDPLAKQCNFYRLEVFFVKGGGEPPSTTVDQIITSFA